MRLRIVLAANLSKKPLTVVLMSLLTEVRKEVQSKSLSNFLNRDWRTLLSDDWLLLSLQLYLEEKDTPGRTPQEGLGFVIC